MVETFFIPPEIIELALPKPGFFSSLFKDTVRQAGIAFEDVYEDAKRVIIAMGSLYADPGHSILNLDNLVSEGLCKLAEMARKGLLEKMDRGSFFAYFKTAIKRHFFRFVKGQKMTLRRTGVSAPGEGASQEKWKEYRAKLPQEVSLDSENVHELIGGSPDSCESEMLADIRALLGPQDLFVLDQLLNPNDAAWCYAVADYDEAREPDKAFDPNVKIGFKHMAAGLQMSLRQFLNVVNRIKVTVKAYMQTGEAFHNEHGPALRRLEEFFGLRHIPRTVEIVVVRRLLTIAARANYTRVTPEIARLLEQVGAKPPQLLSQTLSCFGVMFAPNNPLCGRCGRRTACSVEAANVGLGEITLSPALLGAKMMRIPALIAGEPVSDPAFEDEMMEEVYGYLCENFHHVVVGTDHYFRHNGWQPPGGVTAGGMDGLIFHIQGQKLRFCKPSSSLARKLSSAPSASHAGESFSLPEDASVSEAIDLINQHAKETLSEATV